MKITNLKFLLICFEMMNYHKSEAIVMEESIEEQVG
jgi:hypothetical protein